ncbi:hypothetical protein T11_18345 [Trichinella zimbabwensis]|uniref:Uncharacterized protein n=1 Tax=Trichinella zimbabwensis TaxID=268475 RepID=A0A0V1H6R9_9BILA|nr:hypothetical protein T11_18345 [Trichinella zimbabwensis]
MTKFLDSPANFVLITYYENLIITNILQRKANYNGGILGSQVIAILFYTTLWIFPVGSQEYVGIREIGTTHLIPSDLKFEECAMVDDQLQATYLISDSEITNSISKTNDDANNSSESNSDGEQSPDVDDHCIRPPNPGVLIIPSFDSFYTFGIDLYFRFSFSIFGEFAHDSDNQSDSCQHNFHFISSSGYHPRLGRSADVMWKTLPSTDLVDIKVSSSYEPLSPLSLLRTQAMMPRDSSSQNFLRSKNDPSHHCFEGDCLVVLPALNSFAISIEAD